jgi:inosose dehydratase
MAPQRRIAINPLPWILGDMTYRLDQPILETAMRELRPIGFDRMTVEMPEGTTAAWYGQLLADNGFGAAPGYFSGNFADASKHAELAERIRAHARAHVELGLDTAFIAHDLTPERIAQPAIGAAPDPSRWPVIAQGLVAATDAAAAEGVRYALHPHVGSRVEVEDDVRAVLDLTAGSSLHFGPDTGHLYWAGMDPVQIMSDYSDRIIAVHLKDVDAAARIAALDAGDDYGAATNTRHVWTEPGRGAIDFDAVLATLPAEFDGWFVIEVDVPNAGSPAQSSAISYDFLAAQPYFAGSFA